MTAFGAGASLCDTLTSFNLFLVLLGVLYCVVLRPWSKRRGTRGSPSCAEELLQGATVEEGIAQKPAGAKPAGPAVRSAYLDNLKVFLTVLVVMHHVACTFSVGNGGYNVSISRGIQMPDYGYSEDNSFASVFARWFLTVNQSYFMCLFFLISGFFTPSSFDRKGREDFLKDKFQRLGLPLLGFYLVFGPLMSYLETLAFTAETPLADVASKIWYEGAYKNTWFAPGPPWFILWLLNFNVVYAFTDGAPIVLAAPSTAVVFLAAFCVGMIQFVVPSSNFLQVPFGLNQLVANVIFFSVGVLAKRGAWLDALAKLETGTVWFVRFWALLLVGVILTSVVDMRPYVVKDMMEKAPNADLLPFFMGCTSVIMSYAQLQFFQAHLGGSWSILKWASSAAYTVYLIHPPFVVFGVYLYLQILQACGMEVTKLILLADGTSFAPNPGWIIHTDHVEYMWLGFLFTSFVVCGLVLWPVGWGLAKLPGFRLVL